MSPPFAPAYVNSPPQARLAPGVAPAEDVFSPEALSLIATVVRAHGATRELLLAARIQRREALRLGAVPDLNASTSAIRDSAWSVAPSPHDLQNRRVEITGPAHAKLMISALNSGASVFMADLEDALSPSWDNIVGGHRALAAAAVGTLQWASDTGELRRPNSTAATLTVRPRGLHLLESHVEVDGVAAPAGLCDVALLAHNVAAGLAKAGSGLYLYLPKLENHHEAQWWDAVLADLEWRCQLPANSIRVTVLIEHVLAAFEMEEILFSLRDRVTGLNAGRWDYLFSLIRDFGHDPSHVLPDRTAVTMRAPFLTAYSERLVATCHRRGAYAIGGMSAFIPDRTSPEITDQAIVAVQDEKRREAALGYDGAWVAHPDLVPTVLDVFAQALGERANQLTVQAPLGSVADLISTGIAGASASSEGFRSNIRIALTYILAWLGGNGAVAIDHLMEDAATAEISRCQIWQWIHHGTELSDGSTSTVALATDVLQDQAQKAIDDGADAALVDSAADLLRVAMLEMELPPFLTLLAYPHLL